MGCHDAGARPLGLRADECLEDGWTSAGGQHLDGARERHAGVLVLDEGLVGGEPCLPVLWAFAVVTALDGGELRSCGLFLVVAIDRLGVGLDRIRHIRNESYRPGRGLLDTLCRVFRFAQAAALSPDKRNSFPRTAAIDEAMGTEYDQLDPLAMVSAFARGAYEDAATIVTVSLGAVLGSIPLVTAGVAVIAAVDVFTDTTEIRLNGEKISERERLRRFVAAYRRHLYPGLVLSVPLLGPPIATAVYLRSALATGNAVMLVGAALGIYAVVVGVVWTFRAASLIARGDDVSGTAALRDAGYHLLEAPSFGVIHSLLVAVLLGVAVIVPIVVPILLGGLLALLEVVAFEERSGAGAAPLIRAYRGDVVRDEDGPSESGFAGSTSEAERGRRGGDR